jgi:integrase
MSTDPVGMLAKVAMDLNLTGDQVRIAAAIVERRRAGTTLGEVIGQIEQRTGQQVAGRYPQGRRAILDGRAGVDGVVEAVPGFAGLPLDDFTTARVQPLVERIRRISAYSMRSTHGAISGAPENALGRGAARQYVWAATAIGRALVAHNILVSNPMIGLVAPSLAGPSREPNLTDQEVIDYARAILTGSDDPELDAVMFALFRTTGVRSSEIGTLPLAQTDASAGRMTVFGKGGHNAPVPASRPLLARARELHRARCPRCGGDTSKPCTGTLLVGRKGRRVPTNRVNAWSRRVHESCPWAVGHKIQVHVLRHRLARMLRDQYNGDSIIVTLFLRHGLGRHGAAARYMHTDRTDEWGVRVRAAEALFGPLDDWPRLPEWSLLGPWLISAPEGPPS